MYTAPNDLKRQGKPRILFDENRAEFNALVAKNELPPLTNQNLSGLDLQGFKLTGLDLSGCYMRGTNLAGIDLRGCRLDGVSLKGANISGCYFPLDLSAAEITLSVTFGTRLRHPQRRAVEPPHPVS